MRLKAADIRVFLGKSGSGKSTLARFQARRFRRQMIFNPNLEPDWEKGAIVCADPAYLVQLCRRDGPLRVCWQGMGLAEGNEEAFEFANRCALAAGDMVLIWDEVDRFSTAARMPTHAKRIVNAGRHAGLRVFACSRRPYMMNRELTALATRMAIFRTTEPRDLKYFAEYVGAAAEGIPDLAAYHALDWSEHGSAVKKSPFL